VGVPLKCQVLFPLEKSEESLWFKTVIVNSIWSSQWNYLCVGERDDGLHCRNTVIRRCVLP